MSVIDNIFYSKESNLRDHPLYLGNQEHTFIQGLTDILCQWIKDSTREMTGEGCCL